MRNNDHIGKRIRKIREENNITRKELSERTYISEETIRRIEKEDNDPRISTLNSICRYLNVDLEYLLNEDKENNLKLIEYRKKIKYLLRSGDIRKAYLLVENLENLGLLENQINASKHYYKGIINLNDNLNLQGSLNEFYKAFKYIYPNFTLENYKEFSYNNFSLKILLGLAISELRLGRIKLFGLLISYIFDNVDLSNEDYHIYAYYLALYYYKKGNFLTSLSICNISILKSTYINKLFFLNMIYSLKGLVLYELKYYKLAQTNFKKALLLAEISGCI